MRPNCSSSARIIVKDDDHEGVEVEQGSGLWAPIGQDDHVKAESEGHLLPRKSIGLVAVLLLAVGFVSYAAASSSSRSKQSTADTGALTDLKAGGDVAMLSGMLAAWGKGEFDGPDAEFNIRKYMDNDLVWNVHYDFKNTDGFKGFNGIDGVVNWCNFVGTTLMMRDMKTELFAGPPGSGEVWMQMSYTPTVMSTRRSGPRMHDVIKHVIKDGKVVSADYYVGDGATLDSLFPNDVAMLGEMLGAWGKGEFIGIDAKPNIRKYMDDSLVFNAHYDFKNTDGYKGFKGIDGVANRYTFVASNLKMGDTKAELFAGPPGSGEVWMQMSYTPTLTSTGKTGPRMHDVIKHVVKDGKVVSEDYYVGDGATLDGLFTSRPANQWTVE